MTKTLTRVAAERWDDLSEAAQEWVVERIGKDDVEEWDGVADYAVTPDGTGLIPVMVEVGEAEDVWYVRTTDDAGGSDEFPNRPYPDCDSAIAAAEEWATEHDETPDLDALLDEVAESRGWDRDTAERVAEEIAAIPDRSGMRLDVFGNGRTSLVGINVYRYDPDVAFESYFGASSTEDAAMQLLAYDDD